MSDVESIGVQITRLREAWGLLWMIDRSQKNILMSTEEHHAFTARNIIEKVYRALEKLDGNSNTL